MSEWKTIDSAPKDGTDVLLWLKAPWSRVEWSRWYAPWGVWQTDAPPLDHGEGEPYGIGAGIPSHWHPLPEPPKEP